MTAINRPVFVISFCALMILATASWILESPVHLRAALIGGLAGFVLYKASFGFTAGWRNIVLYGRGRGLRAQLLLIGLVAVVAYPLIEAGGIGDWQVRGTVLPMGAASAFGAFIFGIGMQLGSGCASGTLFTAGGGSTRMIVVLAFFIAGSVWATADWDFWAALPRSRTGTSLITLFGAAGAVGIMLVGLAVIWAFSVWIERRRHGALESQQDTSFSLTGPWSIWAGAIGLALVSLLTLLALGRPWGITYGFAVWGAQAVQITGGDPANWTYWGGWRQGHLSGGVLSSATNAGNLGIMIGAMMAAALAGRFSPVWRLSRRDMLTAIIGGLMMGYGARLAYGCNIGAYLGGLTSGSLHGVWWLIWGFSGSTLGVWLRVRIGMDRVT